MTTFAQAVNNQEARTANNMKARKNAGLATVDLFNKIGASRGKNIIPDFVAAYNANKDHALRIALWARDVRGGAGERQLYRDILAWLEKNDADAALALAKRTPELGRYDDLFAFTEQATRQFAFNLIREAINSGNGLAAKWMPRKGAVAAELRTFLELTPKQYRKTLVRLTKVVEQQMCAKQWDEINFSHVPSLAAARYRKAFYKHTDKFKEYVEELKKAPEDRKAEFKDVKVNAAAVYPYDVLKGRISNYGTSITKTELDFIEQQWNALPNYVGGAKVLPMVDVSGSMTARAHNMTVSFLEVAVSLGLYCADKNTGKFKDVFLTFSGSPELLQLKGGINQKIDQMVKSTWAMNTDLHKAFDLVLRTAKINNVSQDEMPDVLLVLSDMQFDYCARFDDSAFEMISRKYAEAGYVLPRLVFWNLNAHDNTPVKFNQQGTALVSGFSPAIAKSVLANDLEDFTPENIMLKTILAERYNY